MRAVLIGLMMMAAPVAVSAQEGKGMDCAQQAALVMTAVNARADGTAKGQARRPLRNALGRTAGDALADWIYSLPKEQLTTDIGTAWETQCKSL